MIIGWLISFFIFPISFTFLPYEINTKLMLAGLGAAFFCFNSVRQQWLGITFPLLGAFSIAMLFSLICFIATDVNYTSDYSYVTYLGSTVIWLSAAYAIGELVRLGHGTFSLRLLTAYLAGVCVMQCGAALAIDNIPLIKSAVDGVVAQGQNFYNEVDRLYGIGAALDSAGIRFSVTLIMIVGVLCYDDTVRSMTWAIVLLLVAFFTIALIGNMISRTTTIGLACALLLFAWASGLFNFVVQQPSLRLGVWFGLVFLSAVAISVFLYKTDADFYQNIRFAFEGFFNWVEHGEWRTDSTDKLNRQMWIWPQDTKTWIIGSGTFGHFLFGTDIGYCRFILYCGLTGFFAFAMFFVYLATYFAYSIPRYKAMFIFLLAVTFLVWLKVTTDIFQFYALFFCLDYTTKGKDQIAPNQVNHANSLLYSRHI